MRERAEDVRNQRHLHQAALQEDRRPQQHDGDRQVGGAEVANQVLVVGRESGHPVARADRKVVVEGARGGRGPRRDHRRWHGQQDEARAKDARVSHTLSLRGGDHRIGRNVSISHGVTWTL